MTQKTLCLLLISICLNSCKSNKISHSYIPFEYNSYKDNTNIELINWHHKDIIDDTIPGISLQKAYTRILEKKEPKEIIIAILDTEIDINHEGISNQIWVNSNEIPNNNIDDDNNGYIDDINGWNFINNKKGETTYYSNFESTRIVRYYNNNLDKLDSIGKNKHIYDIYKRAILEVDNGLKNSKKYSTKGPKTINRYKLSLQKITPLLAEKKQTIKRLDSLKNIYPEYSKEIKFLSRAKQFNLTLEDLEEDLQHYENCISKYYNVNYDERQIITDNPNDINDTDYGSNLISNNRKRQYHGTSVAGVITNINTSFKVMPLSISAYGDEHDKDIALAIRYAVNNGAKVINISSGKDFSLHKSWVLDAILYAEKNNVLIVTSAGNNSKNLDLPELENYPNDENLNGEELTSNFIKVGASNYLLDNNLKDDVTNFGKDDVDVFAPGNKIYTTSLKENEAAYAFKSGTSYAAPIVSGVAGLIYAYYPNLSVSEIKKIIIETGITYSVLVNTPTKENNEKMIPFNELSKSGKIINAYNALLMAESTHKKIKHLKN